jgi:hypothetical protein
MAIATGCVTYKSVKATALLGKDLDEHSKGLDSISQICTLTEGMSISYLECSKESQQQDQYQKTAKVISAYSAKLEELVGQQQELDYGTELSSIVKGFTSVEWDKLAKDASMQGKLLTPLKGVANLIVDAAVKKELYTVVTEADPFFQQLKNDVGQEFKNRAGALTNANSQINDQIRSNSLQCSHKIVNPDSPKCEDACDIRLILACRDFRDMNQGWEDYKKALFSFIDAHHELQQGFSADKVLKDPETYKKVLDAVKAVYGATQKDKSS